MKIAPVSVKLVHQTKDPEMVVEDFGRIAYQSYEKQRPCPLCRGSGMVLGELGGDEECPTCRGWGTDPATAKALVAHIIKLGHESVLEHVCLGVKIITDRGVTHEKVRHRTGVAFTQESTRFCGYDGEKFGGEIQCIEPPGLDDGLKVDGEFVRQEVWREAMKFAEMSYNRLRELGVAPQIARSVLPTGLKSEIGVTANAREWRHILSLRLDPKAHPQMREAMSLVLPHLVKWLPQAFEEFVPVKAS